jgi:hypothetical protein
MLLMLLPTLLPTMSSLTMRGSHRQDIKGSSYLGTRYQDGLSFGLVLMPHGLAGVISHYNEYLTIGQCQNTRVRW